MDLRWLNDFLAVAETGNFTKAAEQRNSSQAAFSRRLQALEAWVGKPLIDRSFYPTRLTPEGEQFRAYATEIARNLTDARAEISGGGATKADHIRIAIPYALATTRLPTWWAEWTDGQKLTCSLMLGNIHDLGAALVAGEVDVAICFYGAQEPMFLDMARFDKVQIETDRLRPWAAKTLVASDQLQFPGTPRRPVPLLRYSRGIYFARLVDAIIDAAPTPLSSTRVMESDMADVLREMAIAGHGVAWLPDSGITPAAADALTPLGGDGWGMDISIVAYCDRTNRRAAVHRLWSGLKQAEPANLHPVRKPAIKKKPDKR
jgi:DNA-binding transcriptional LysR family regulator